jgi:tRNA U55 pseudouridine synthase TruB
MVKPENRVEKYAFLRLYEHDLEMALQTAKIMNRYRKTDVKFALLRDLVVTYCRPFTESRGEGITKDFFAIKKFESNEMKELHNELMELRSSLFAHTDLNFKKTQIANWSNDEKKWFPMAFRGYDYTLLADKVPEIVKLISYARNQLVLQIRQYEESF